MSEQGLIFQKFWNLPTFLCILMKYGMMLISLKLFVDKISLNNRVRVNLNNNYSK